MRLSARLWAKRHAWCTHAEALQIVAQGRPRLTCHDFTALSKGLHGDRLLLHLS